MIPINNMSSYTKILIVLFNVFVFMVVFHSVDMNMTAEVVAAAEITPPREVLLPHITITDEMRVDMFFEKLNIDYSFIVPEEIALSITPWEPYIKQYSRKYNIDPDLVRAIIYAESKGDPYSISKDGAMGLMQIMPATAASLGISDMLDPEENIKAGVKYIAWLVSNYDEDYILWAWNAGPGMLEKKRIPGETKKFIVKVLSVRTFLKDINSKNNAI